MEKQKINFSYKKLVSKFHFRGDIMGNADLLWRSSLWFFLFALIAIITVGYLTYEWAVSADEPHVAVKTERPTLSLTELESVIGLYQKKQSNFTKLLGTPPKAPAYQRSVGVPVPSSAIPESPKTAQPDTALPAAGGPQG